MAPEPAPFTDGFDEAFAAPGEPRPEYAEVLARLGELGPAVVRDRVQSRLSARGARFGTAGGGRPFVIDPVPRILPSWIWAPLAAGIAQRVRALEAFVHDAYGERRCVREGIVSDATIDSAEGYEPRFAGRLPPVSLIGVAGLDLVRGPDGEFLVLEDNVRTPSGFAYAAAARDALAAELEAPGTDFGAGALAGLALTIRAAAPPGVEDPAAVIVSDGPTNSAFYEHERAAAALGLPLVRLGELERRGAELVRRDAAGRAVRVDVVYRRTDEDRPYEEDGAYTPVGELLVEPWLAGRLGLVNGYGTGVADDKAVHAHVEDLIRLYVGEEPLLRSVATYDLSDPACLAEALERIGELVVKPRLGHGGYGVVVCAHATRADVAAAAARIRAEPEQWVAQPTVALSVHPTVAEDGTLAPRHVDLRPYAFAARDRVEVPPGGLTRVALAADALVVNSSQRGGGKDTWVTA